MNEYWLKMLYDANYEMLYRIASNRLTLGMGHDSDVQDVLQEVLRRHRNRIYTIIPIPSVGWWLQPQRYATTILARTPNIIRKS